MRVLSRSSRWILLCFLAAGILGGTTPPAPAPPTAPATGPLNPGQAYAKLDSFLQEQIQVLGIPGAAVAVVKDGVRVHTAAFGRADDSGRPLTAQTPVLLASTSKTLTAIAVMQQVEAGRLRLDERVGTYLPWFTLKDSRASEITVRHLLHQASGMSARARTPSSRASGPCASEASKAVSFEAMPLA